MFTLSWSGGQTTGCIDSTWIDKRIYKFVISKSAQISGIDLLFKAYQHFWAI